MSAACVEGLRRIGAMPKRRAHSYTCRAPVGETDPAKARAGRAYQRRHLQLLCQRAQLLQASDTQANDLLTSRRAERHNQCKCPYTLPAPTFRRYELRSNRSEYT